MNPDQKKRRHESSRHPLHLDVTTTLRIANVIKIGVQVCNKRAAHLGNNQVFFLAHQMLKFYNPLDLIQRMRCTHFHIKKRRHTISSYRKRYKTPPNPSSQLHFAAATITFGDPSTSPSPRPCSALSSIFEGAQCRICHRGHALMNRLFTSLAVTPHPSSALSTLFSPTAMALLTVMGPSEI